MISRIDKLIGKIRNNPKDVRFDDACKVAEAIGFAAKGGKGSHNSFSRTGEPVGLNFQEINGGRIPRYQAKQLIEMIDKYHQSERQLQELRPQNEPPHKEQPKKGKVRRQGRTKRD